MPRTALPVSLPPWRRFMQSVLMYAVVLLNGAAIMVFEVTGSRVISPYLGSSLIVWTSIIGIILASMSIGNWAGGRLADWRPLPLLLSGILLLTAIGVSFTNFLSPSVLEYVSREVDDYRWQAVLAALLLFTPASIFSGMVTPFTIRMQMEKVETSGNLIGRISAVATLGSIIGTFSAGFLLLAYFGTVNVLNGVAVVLLFLSILLSGFTLISYRTILLVLLLTVFPAYASYATLQRNQGYVDVDTAYARVHIYPSEWTDRKPIRVMEIDHMLSSAMYLYSPELVFDYTKYYRLSRHFNPSIQRALLIGGAGYSYAKDFLIKNPQAELDVVEIDPQLTQLAREYFKLPDSPRLHIYHTDGRRFLNQNKQKYDVIFVDAFSSYYSIPFELTTQEAVGKIRDSLSERGVVMTNIISSAEGSTGQLLQAMNATYRKVFPQTALFLVQQPDQPRKVQNCLLVAGRNTHPWSNSSADPELASYLTHQYLSSLPTLPVLTDQFAPVDRYIQPLLTVN